MSTTWNPDDKHASITLSGGNLTATWGETGWRKLRSTLGVVSGKWYWEITIGTSAGSSAIIGAGDADSPLDARVGDTHSHGYHKSGEKWHDNNDEVYGDVWGVADIISVALDLDNGKIWFAKNGVWQASGDPAAGTNEAYSGISGTYYPMQSFYLSAEAATANFGATAFAYSAPSGFTGFDESATEVLYDLNCALAAAQQLLSFLNTDIRADYAEGFSNLKSNIAALGFALQNLKTDIEADYAKGYEDLTTDVAAANALFEDLLLNVEAAITAFQNLDVAVEIAHPVREKIQFLRYDHVPAHSAENVDRTKQLQLRVFNPDPQFGVDPATFWVKLNGTKYSYGDSQIYTKKISYREYMFYVTPPVFGYDTEVQAEVYCEDHLGNPGLLREVM